MFFCEKATWAIGKLFAVLIEAKWDHSFVSHLDKKLGDGKFSNSAKE